MSRRILPSDFVRSTLHNGVGRHVCQLQRITFKFCKSHGSSRGIRDFVEHHLLAFSRENPGIVVYLKPRRWRAAVLRGEYLNQQAVQIPVNGFNHDEICQWVEHLRCRNGNQIVPLEKRWYTESPSVQGIWTPYTNKDPRNNVMDFPNPEIGSAPKLDLSATEKLVKLMEEMKMTNVVVQEEEGEEGVEKR